MGLRSKLREEGVTVTTVLFEFFIILAGVYVAIAFDDFVTKRESATQARAALIAVAAEVERDKEDIHEVLGVQRDRLEAYAGIVSALENPATESTHLDSLFRAHVSPNRTFFPRNSAYTVMLTSDQLIHVSNETLRLRLIDLYERDYERLARNGEVFDNAHQGELQREIVSHWDYKNLRLREGQRSREALTNAALRMDQWASRYMTLLESHVPVLDSALSGIEAYVAR